MVTPTKRKAESLEGSDTLPGSLVTSSQAPSGFHADCATTSAKAENGRTTTSLSSFIWSLADLLRVRGDYKRSDFGKVILPFTLLRHLDCMLEATAPEVLAEEELPA